MSLLSWLYVLALQLRAGILLGWYLSSWSSYLDMLLGLFADDESAPAVPGIKEKTENGPRENELLGKDPALHDGTG